MEASEGLFHLVIIEEKADMYFRFFLVQQIERLLVFLGEKKISKVFETTFFLLENMKKFL